MATPEAAFSSQMAQVIHAPARPHITGVKTIFLAGSIDASTVVPVTGATTTTTTATATEDDRVRQKTHELQQNDWRAALAASLAHLAVTLFNPVRRDWSAEAWSETEASDRFREQVDWELDMQEAADLLVVYLAAGTDAPISLLELGLYCGRRRRRPEEGGSRGDVVVVCEPGYPKKGNVQIVGRRYGARVVEGGMGRLTAEVRRWLAQEGVS
ncbi:hypothetical protein VTK73DRAFT_3623 [Phialemonium thermophilum]|uniref:Uncharacterized protein n=1 Tax=Phialemonium thermophilum TaxID=223376 RepID=A0ABR3VGT3_9PEZI